MNKVYANPTASNATDKTKVLTGMYGNVTLSAQWTVNRYEVTFNAKGGTFADGADVDAYVVY